MIPLNVGSLKRRYKPGTKVKLVRMDDVQAPEPGTVGIVQHVDDAGQIHVKWPSGSSLALIPEVDAFEIIG